MKRSTSFRSDLLEDLRDPVEAAHYLAAAAEDSPELLEAAKRDVAAANNPLRDLNEACDSVLKRESVALPEVHMCLEHATERPCWRCEEDLKAMHAIASSFRRHLWDIVAERMPE